MTELADKVDELKKIQEGDAWHGPALREVLAGVTAEQALAKPIPDAHSIWELVLHIMAWGNVFTRRLQGQPLEEPPEGDFPPIGERTHKAWNETVKRLERGHAEFVSTVAGLSESRLTEKAPGRPYTLRFLINSTVRHHVYHTGQIALLKKSFTG